MACPKCGCKCHYSYDDSDNTDFDTYLERCAACGHIFDFEESVEDEEEVYEHPDTPKEKKE